jgi:MFS family permease
MVQALLLAGWPGRDGHAGHLIVLAFGLGCINALDVPARQAIVVQLVDDKADLPNAIALNSFMMHATRFVGPALAGWVVATPARPCASCSTRRPTWRCCWPCWRSACPPAAAQGRPAAAGPARRVRYTAGQHIRASLLLIASLSLLATPYTVLMPLFARRSSAATRACSAC